MKTIIRPTEMPLTDEMSSIKPGTQLLEHFSQFELPRLEVRLANKMGLTSAQARELFVDLRQWMFLCAVSDVALSPPPAIDEAWHHFILFTAEYAAFCEKFCGRFIHHFPFDGMPKDPKRKATRIATSIAAKRAGISLSSNWYPTTAESCVGGSSDCNSCCAPSGYAVAE